MTAIRVQNLSKVYKLYDSKKDRLKEAVNPFKKKYHRDFYALNDISFEVQQGETIGIIGKNGSGKSTLLKMITGLITPTVGNIEVKGKVSALLELGAGFNPEYTGLENIYLHGLIMGFTREEMNAKLDDIVSFADIGDFVHQSVKIYSSGMYVRLAFAVAINVEPDILIIDEALSVGDMRFQQKCYRKINNFREQGKTILFCTHDTGAVLNLCSSCIWIHDGVIKDSGDPDSIVKQFRAYMYYDQSVNKATTDQKVNNNVDDGHTNMERIDDLIPWQNVDHCSFFGEGGARITHVCFYEEDTRKPAISLKGGEKVVLGVKAKALSTIDMPMIGFHVKNALGVYAFGTNTIQENEAIPALDDNNEFIVYFRFELPLLANGKYSVDVAMGKGTQAVHVVNDWKHDVHFFDVENIGDKYGYGYVYLDSVSVNIKCHT